MNRHILLLLLLANLSLCARAQYADRGNGSLRTELWWFDWAGFNMANGASRTFTTADGLTVDIRFSNVSALIPRPEVMNTWSGAILHLLYNFSDPAVKPALLERSTSMSQFTMQITATRDGQPAGFTLVTADAEASSQNEVTTFTTNGGNWHTIDFYRNSNQTNNPLTGCNTPTVALAQTYGGGPVLGQVPLLATESTSGSLTIGVTMDHRAAIGTIAVAFGIMAPIDRGDLPATYGFAHHRIKHTVNNTCNFNPPFPSLARDHSLYIGTTPPDSDISENSNDNASGNDEEDASLFPVYNGAGTYSIQVPVHNSTGQQTYLYGWFDNNRNGRFEPGERTSTTIAPYATTATLSWNGLPAYLAPGSTKGYGFRLRIGSDALATQQPAGFATDGEVEDYFIDEEDWCKLNVKTNADVSICAGQAVNLLATGAVNYQWDNGTFLSNQYVADPVAQPDQNVRYIVTGSTPQGCIAKDTVHISVKPKPAITLSPAAAICQGGNTTLTASAPGATSYNWSPASGLSDATVANPVASPASATQYTVSATGAGICEARAAVTVDVNPLPVTSVTRSNDITCMTSAATLRAQGGNSYEWDALPGITQLLSPAPVVSPVVSTMYFVTIKGAHNCSRRDSVQVLVDFSKNDNQYLLPSAFTPNNDGNNDCFGLKNWGIISSLQFEVYNRWGQRVFVTNNPLQCWDGRFQGQPQPSGGFAYQIRATTSCGSILRKGMVMLLR